MSQQKFNSLMQEAMQLLATHQADGVLLVSQPDPVTGEDSVDFCGNTGEDTLVYSAGYHIGVAIAQDDEMGPLIAQAIMDGSTAFRNGDASLTKIKQQATTH